MNNKLIWMWLSLHFGAGSLFYQKLYNYFGSLEAIYDCDDADVAPLDWLPISFKRKILDKNTEHAEQVLEWCDDHKVKVVTPSDAEYPYPLRAIDDYPAVLYYVGKLPNFRDELCVSVVGTRKMTIYGQKNAYELGYGLAKGGALVVSGMALGIDCTAQKGALYAGGSSVAILGSGIDVVYPQKNLELMKKLARVGAVITEYPPHTPPNGSNFPIRNRIISALSVATVVVEADTNSGSLITARKALKQGKDLFAYPGDVKSFSSSGTNQLLTEGAMVARGAIDVLEQYLDVYSDKINLSASKEKPVFKSGSYADTKFKMVEEIDSEEIKKSSKKITETKREAFDTSKLNDEQKLIYEHMEFGKPISLEAFSNLEIDTSNLSSLMTMLEIAGAIESLPGGFYIKK